MRQRCDCRKLTSLQADNTTSRSATAASTDTTATQHAVSIFYRTEHQQTNNTIDAPGVKGASVLNDLHDCNASSLPTASASAALRGAFDADWDVSATLVDELEHDDVTITNKMLLQLAEWDDVDAGDCNPCYVGGSELAEVVAEPTHFSATFKVSLDATCGHQRCTSSVAEHVVSLSSRISSSEATKPRSILLSNKEMSRDKSVAHRLRIPCTTFLKSPSDAGESVATARAHDDNLTDTLRDLQVAYSTIPCIPPAEPPVSSFTNSPRSDNHVEHAHRLESHLEYIMHLEERAMRMLLGSQAEDHPIICGGLHDP
jgi:hypothetical protein